MNAFIKIAKDKGMADCASTVCATGGGAHKFEADFRREVNMKLNKVYSQVRPLLCSLFSIGHRNHKRPRKFSPLIRTHFLSNCTRCRYGNILESAKTSVDQQTLQSLCGRLSDVSSMGKVALQGQSIWDTRLSIFERAVWVLKLLLSKASNSVFQTLPIMIIDR